MLIDIKNLEQNLVTYKKFSKWITDFNVKCKIMKHLEGNIRANPCNPGLVEVLDVTPNHTPLKINKWDFIIF